VAFTVCEAGSPCAIELAIVAEKLGCCAEATPGLILAANANSSIFGLTAASVRIGTVAVTEVSIWRSVEDGWLAGSGTLPVAGACAVIKLRRPVF
jgi:hypothetical protein